MWIIENKNIAEIDGDFDDYRMEVLKELNEKIEPSANSDKK